MIRFWGRGHESELRSSLAELVRRHDRERYLTALFVPAERREAVLALFAFNYEIARTREVVSEPLLGRIRLQWWREGIDGAYSEGAVRVHEVLTPLGAAIRDYRLSRATFDRMIDARERDLEAEPPPTLAVLETYCEDTSGGLQSLVLEVLGEHGEAARDAARAAGTAFALSGLIRAIPFHARTKRQFIPADLAEGLRLDPRDLFELRGSPALAAVAERLAAKAEEHLARARAHRREIPRAALPALLPARLAAQHLRRLRGSRFDVFAPAVGRPISGAVLSLMIAAMTGRY
jgi:NADH dehydrogenase [ubiquinone] 1 alpha subcomplex assembly factor 6